MATPTQAPTKVPQEPDPFYYDYDTVQTVGMTLATILFLLGILIIISKKVKCRKADSRSESPTCKSCLGNDDPARAHLQPRSRDSVLQLLGSGDPPPAPQNPGLTLSCTSLSPRGRPVPLHPGCLRLELNKCAFGFSPCSVCVVLICGDKMGSGQN
ncbi:FXYD domain-containing ion transport regulator 7 isoform X1 [Manis pentadactyla]|uniref:FXYD domain-containing ion transport regulator 7 isoform X1 n=1 Tax=Manis pentadactyla TaxID=143292 RepID=UPI00255CD0DD|nr:FXYD domain-containing ion transport regulator 7 isoform X1 [Manis pentadactyla]